MTFILLNIIGGVALLLWGTRMLKNGVTRACGTSLQQAIARSTDNRITAFFAGLGVTALLQSSTATAMICASFASKQMIGTAAALAVVIGADISTTLVAQLLTFDLSWLMPVLLIAGVALHHRYEHAGYKRHLSRTLIGLGLVLLSLSLIKQSALPLRESEILPVILKPLENEPVLAILVAGALTWLLHSSLATVLIIASFATGGLINMKLGLLLVLGANLGGAIVPYAMTVKADARARRITTGNLIMRTGCILLALPFMTEIESVLPAGSRSVIHFHTLFNIALACLFLPLVTPLAKLCERVVRDKEEDKPREDRPLYLDETVLDSPAIALAAAAHETLRVSKIVETMFADSMTALKDENRDMAAKIRVADNIVDRLYQDIKIYLTRVSEAELDPGESDRLVQILSFSTSLEHAGDTIEKSLIDIVDTKIKQKIRFSDEGFREIQDFHHTILQNMKIAQTIFMSEDPKLAHQLIEGKASVRKAAQHSAQQHFQRLREGVPETRSTSALHTDIIRDYKRINSYITTVAFSVLDQNGSA